MTMTAPDLAEIARRTRQVREAGVALVLASGVLAVFLFIPLAPSHTRTAAGEATTTPRIAELPIEAKAAIIYDVATGKTLYEKNADVQLPLASLTKLLTVYAALSELPASAPITVSENAARMEAPHAFPAGTTLTLADLARLTLTGSLNDGAAAIAEAVAAHEERPVPEALASAAAGLGLAQTYALNGNGLDVNDAISGGYGSARDMAHLAGALAASAPAIAMATTLGTAEAAAKNGTTYTAKNTDPITMMIPGLLLSKTGYTDLAGGNLALVFDAGIGHPVAIVVLGSSKDSRFTDGMTLVDGALAYFAGVPSL